MFKILLFNKGCKISTLFFDNPVLLLEVGRYHTCRECRRGGNVLIFGSVSIINIFRTDG